MFELFIALFGGLYYGTKILREKSATKVSDSKFRKASEIFETLHCSVEDECSVINSLMKPKDRVMTLNTISDELEYIFGDNWMSKYKPETELPFKYVSTFGSDRTGNPWWVAINVLLANQGKLNALLRTHSLWGTDDAVNIQKKTFDMIERCIQKYRPEYYIVIVPDNFGGSKGFVRWNFQL